MKRLSLALVLMLVTATAVFAGEGKSCDMKKSGKAVELTGTLTHTEKGDVFRIANSGDSYNVCEMTKSSILKMNDGKTTLHIKGELVSCGEGTELVITEAKKI